jgi:hypothetical protein
LDKYSVYKLKNTSVISIQSIKSKASTLLIIKNISLLNNYLIPYFRVMKFYSKKAKDFKDFQLICEAVYKGSHKTEEVKALILRLSYTMNSYRLSTNKIKEQLLSQKELDIIQNASPTFEWLEDGRLREVDTGKVVTLTSQCIYEVIKPNGEVLILDSLREVLKIIGAGYRTLMRHINEES